MTESTKTRKRLSLTAYIAIALGLGVLAGLFFGEKTIGIKWVGDAFVGLLQMAVLPYVAVSLIANVGRLSLSGGARLLRVSLLVLLVLWSIALITLAVMTLAFPVWETGSFFSSSFSESPPAHDWMALFVPSNPFESLANNAIPAVVVFSIGLGIALINLPNKARILDPLDVVVNALGELSKLVIKLTPIGLFAIVAYNAGTIDVAEFSLMQGYLLTYGVSSLILTFFILPSLIAAFTPLRVGEIVKTFWDPLIAAFVIGNTFVVLPMIIESLKQIQEKRGLVPDHERNEPEFLIPLAYPFPDVGRIIGLIFIPFAAWFYGNTIELDSYPSLVGVGLLGSFGKLVITIPMLLELAELPSDIFGLFLASGVIAARFGDLMKTMHLLTFTILVGCIVNGTARPNWRKLIVGTVLSVALLMGSVALIRSYLELNFKDHYSKENLVTEREMAFPRFHPLSPIQPVLLAESTPNPVPIAADQSRVQRIQQRGIIRIGFDADKMPFAYFNAAGHLIGFDIEMAYHLADDLKVNIEFVPIDRERLHQDLADDHYDVAMSAFEGTVQQAAALPAIEPYMEVTLAIVVPDHNKRRFRSRKEMLKIPDLKLGVLEDTFFTERAPKLLAIKEDIQVVRYATASEYFEQPDPEADGLVISAESGSAWTLRNPKFTVANPLHGETRVPLYYLTCNDEEFEKFLQNWLTLKRSDGTYQQLYDYWILGQNDDSRETRWCILRDVLHWID